MEWFAPAWLGPEDHPWLEALRDELVRFEGRPMRAWQARAAEPLRAEASVRKVRLAVATLTRLCAQETPALDPKPPVLRESLFEAAQRAREGAFDRDTVLSTVAARFDLAPTELLDRLYLDIPAERPLALLTALPDAASLARHTNQSIAQSLVRAASQVEIRLQSRSRPLIRQVLLRRLLATVRPRGSGVAIEVSGPFALFRHTTMYGGSLASLLPVLRGADGFELLARVTMGQRPVTVRLASGDPIFPPDDEPRRFDSQLEARFARDFAKRAPGWDLSREPEPIAVGGTWIFPDFALTHRRDRRRWLLEIVGFWTPEYLATKLERLARAGREDLIVVVDERLACGAETLPVLPRVIPFRGRVDAEAVLRVMESTQPKQVSVPTERRLVQAGDLFLDYAGRRPATDPIHTRLAALAPGDPVALHRDGRGLFVVDAAGQPLAALSTAARARWAPRLESVRAARVVAVRTRSRAESHPDYQGLLLVERWRVPVVEVEIARPVS